MSYLVKLSIALWLMKYLQYQIHEVVLFASRVPQFQQWWDNGPRKRSNHLTLNTQRHTDYWEIQYNDFNRGCWNFIVFQLFINNVGECRCLVSIKQHVKARSKWPPTCSRYFECILLKAISFIALDAYLTYILTYLFDLYSLHGLHWWCVSIVTVKGLMQTREK